MSSKSGPVPTDSRKKVVCIMHKSDCLIHKTVKSQTRTIHEYDNENYKTPHRKAIRQS